MESEERTKQMIQCYNKNMLVFCRWKKTVISLSDNKER